MNELIIATDESTALDPELVKRFHILVIPRQARRGRTSSSVSEARALERGNLPVLIPAPVQTFTEAFRKFARAQIVSIHAPQLIDGAVHQAQLAASMVAPQTQVQVYESKLFHSGLALRVETAARFVADGAGTVTAEQVVVLLRRLEQDIRSLLFVKGLNGQSCEPPLNWSQKIACLFGRWVPIQYQPADRLFHQLTPAQVEQWFSKDGARELFAEWYRGSPRQLVNRQARAALLMHQPSVQFGELRVKNPGLPKQFIQVTEYPPPIRIKATVQWVRRWSEQPVKAEHQYA